MILLGTVLLDLLLHQGSAKNLAGICSLFLGRVVYEDAYSFIFSPPEAWIRTDPSRPLQRAT